MRKLNYDKISNIAEDIMDLADGLGRGDWGPLCATDNELHHEFISLALELDYVVKRYPRNDARCPYTIEMAIDERSEPKEWR